MKCCTPVVWALALALPVASLGVGSLSAAPEPGKETVRKEHTLPKDKQAAVITLDYKGGFTPPRSSDKPALTILADGTVKMPARFQGQKSYDGKITQAELQELLDFAIDGQKFFEYDPKKVAEKKLAQGPQIQVADAATTVIRIQADGQDKEFSHYALGFGTDIDELKRLAVVQQRLQRLMATIQIGGNEKVQEFLKRANEKLKEKHPGAAPLTTENFQSAHEGPENSKFVQFVRQVNDAEGKQVNFTAVSFNEQANGKSDVQVNYVEGK